MEEAVRWGVWGFSFLIPFAGLVWCATTPVHPSLRRHEVVEAAPER